MLKKNYKFKNTEIELIILGLINQKYVILDEFYKMKKFDGELRRKMSIGYHMHVNMINRLLCKLPEIAIRRVKATENKLALDWVNTRNSILEAFVELHVEDIKDPEKYY